MAYIRLCKIMLKGGITKKEFQTRQFDPPPYYCAGMRFALLLRIR